MDKNKRCAKTTRQQFELYLNELTYNKAFRENKFDGKDPDVLKRSWENLCTKLNSMGGPVKDINGWKRTFTDWKSQVKNKARKLKHDFEQTGNIGSSGKPLSDIEDQLLSIIGKVVVDGFPEVPELGMAIPMMEREEAHKQSVSTIVGGSNESISTPSGSLEHEPITPSNKRKRASLTACLETLVTENKTSSILQEISNNIKESNKIKKKTLKLKQLELQVKYPKYSFVVTSSDSE